MAKSEDEAKPRHAMYEHVEYIPFGETWIEEREVLPFGASKSNRYLFTSKEFDQETRLYYYGARYYDPKTSIWLSPDPILDKYLDGQGNTGVYNSFNLNLYAYVYQNPVRLVDHSGAMPHPDDFSGSKNRGYKKADWSGRKQSLFQKGLDIARDIFDFVFFDPSEIRGDIEKGDYLKAAGKVLTDVSPAGKGRKGYKRLKKLFKGQNPKKGKKATDSGKNEPHGDQDAMTKADKQIEELKKQMEGAPKKKRKKINKKIDHIRQNAHRDKGGETHGIRGKHKKR